MRIKRIDLCGFKSFCDKTAVDLQQPITAVVGPNGCGKSNIVDAVRWAMGEQSARHLRGKSMEDVIFNGSDARGPAGMAEISITFENDGRVPVEYLDYSEITVSRRLHRDGTSEYLLNKVPVRLRDVTNLFLGTGVGTKAYSIIEQGRVGLIVSAKPEDRRYFIEEAAGITKYRRRKLAAERKMEATRQNLLRVSDVIEEIGNRLGSLRRQAQKAERYKRYRDEMRDIELWAASHRLLEQIAEQKLLDSDRDRMSVEYQGAEAELQRQETALESSRLEAMEEERELQKLQEQLYQLDNQVKLDESQAAYHEQEAEQLEQRSAQSRGEVDELNRQLEQLALQHQALQTACEELAERRGAAEHQMEARQEELDSRRAELVEIEEAVGAEQVARNEAEREIAATEAKLRALEVQRSDLGQRSELCGREAQQMIAELATLQARAEGLEERLGGLRVDLRQVEQRRQHAAERLVELRDQEERGQAELEVVRTELHRRRSRLASLEEIQARHEGLGQGTRAILQRHEAAEQDGVLGVVADLVEAPARYETALEAVLGQRLGTVIVDSDRSGLEAIDYLKQSGQGRSSFISREVYRSLLDEADLGVVWAAGQPALEHVATAGGMMTVTGPGVVGPMLGLIDVDRDYQPVAEMLLGDVVVVEDLPGAMELASEQRDRTLVTLEGDIVAPDGTVTGGSHEGEISGVLRQKREIKELTEIIADLQQQYDSAFEQHLALKTEMTRLEQVHQEATQEEHEGDKGVLTHEKDLGRVREDLERCAARRQQLEREGEQIARQLGELDVDAGRLAERIAACSEQQRLAVDTLYALAGAKQRAAAAVDAAATGLTDSKVELAEAAANHQAIEQQLVRQQEARDEREKRVESLQRSANEGLERVEQLREEIARLREELSELVTRRAATQDELSSGRKQYEERLAAVTELELALKEQRTKVSDLNVELGKLQLRGSELSMARNHLEEQVWERYREDLVRVMSEFHLRPPVSDEQLERLEQLRQLIDRMGHINLTAIEEYNELDERYTFLNGQQSDLQQALDQLQRAIQKINRTCRQRFVETFERVDEKFREVFPRLFRGGRAKLMLSGNTDDMLQAGVEIVAQPPGKKLVSIDMMSGGEKALTATSLIFAMFLVKPTPFCVLDEVDAPLDDANVIRLRDLIQEMSDTSQFIMITHNRRTMEIADRLYGVTMEEPGVSKLVSVNLNEAEAVAA